MALAFSLGQRRQVLAGDGGHADARELAPVSATAAILAPALELEDPDLLAAQVLDDLGGDAGALHVRLADGDLVAVPEHEDLIELELGPRFARQMRDLEHLVLGDPGLDAGDVHDGVHGTVDSPGGHGTPSRSFRMGPRAVPARAPLLAGEAGGWNRKRDFLS